MASLVACMFIVSCSEKEEGNGIVDKLTDGVPVSVQLTSQPLPGNIECDLYIYYKKTAESVYKLKEVISFGNQDTKQAQFNTQELNTGDYRLLFVGVPASYNNELVLSGVSLNSSWDDVRITAGNHELSDDFYYKVLSIPGSQILADGRIDAVLGRLVGQVTIDVYHINADGAPDDIEVSTVGSVLDRVKKIDIVYSGLTKVLSFDADGNPVEEEPFSGTYSQVIEPILGGDLTVDISSQNEDEIVIAGNNKIGSVRIRGFYCLPATNKVRVKSTFEFVDTTPGCANNHDGEHVEGCYPLNTIVLNLPQENAPDNDLLSILPNHFTINQAGIWQNRIIDVPQEGSFGFNVAWANR